MKKNTSSFGLWIGVLIAIVVVVLVIVKVVGSPGGGGSIASTSEITYTDWTKGSEDATVTLIEYSDFQCPACRSYHSFLNRLTAEFGDNILFSYRHFPLHQIHPNAGPAAEAAEAAGRQGKFWEMHDKLFDNQGEWEGSHDAEELFTKYAGELGLDIEQFQTDMDSKEVRDKVRADENSGTAARVQGTPSLFLNGEKVQNPGRYEDLKKLVESAGAVAPESEPVFKTKSADTPE